MLLYYESKRIQRTTLQTHVTIKYLGYKIKDYIHSGQW